MYRQVGCKVGDKLIAVHLPLEKWIICSQALRTHGTFCLSEKEQGSMSAVHRLNVGGHREFHTEKV